MNFMTQMHNNIKIILNIKQLLQYLTKRSGNAPIGTLIFLLQQLEYSINKIMIYNMWFTILHKK